MAVIPRTETAQGILRREESARYLVDRLIVCTPLNASRVDHGTSLYRRLNKAVEYSVLGPLSALQGCTIGAVFDDEA